MNARADIAWSRQIAGITGAQAALWALCALLVLGTHAGAAWWLTQQQPEALVQEAAPAAIMIDLAPATAAAVASEDNQAVDEVDSVEVDVPDPVEPVETIEPLEAVQTTEVAEPVEAAEPVETPAPVDMVQPAEEAPAEEVEALVPAEPAEPEPIEPVETAQPVAVDPVAPIESTSVSEVTLQTLEPVEVDPVEAMIVAELDRVDIPLPTERPEPPRRTARQEEPREQPRRAPAPPKQEQAAPSRAQQRAQARSEPAPRAAAQQSAPGAAATISPARWQSRLMSHLERRKRYPTSARRARQEGVAQVRFSIDANGNVGSVSLARSSGVAALDQEVVDMVRRASPVPAPPPGVGRTIVVPVRFSLR
jgi:protein TonB